MKKILAVLGVTAICFYSQGAFAEDQQMEQLRLQTERLQVELQQLQSQSGGLISGLPATPKDKIKLVIDSVNRAYSDITQNLFTGALATSGQLVPVPYASRISGYIEVSGLDTDPPSHGWVPLDLKYNAREEFIGYMITTRYYDTKARAFTKQKDYLIGSISTDIKVSALGGRQCVKARSGQCDEWSSFAKSEIDDSNNYPSLYEWVILGDSADGQVTIKIDSPSIYFTSLDKRAGRSLGCFGTTLQLSLKELSEHIKAQFLSTTELVGKPGSASNCDPGSTIELRIDFCDKTQYANLIACNQLEILLGSMKQALALRDAYKKMGGQAEDIDQLSQLVSREISADYPLINLEDDNFLDNYSAAFKCGVITLPDLCKGCMPKPLCTWEREALLAHESMHQEQTAPDSHLYKLLCSPDILYRVKLYPEEKQLRRAQAIALAEMEYDAYDEQARHLKDIIQQQLPGIFDCTLSPTFLLDYHAAQHRLDTH